MREDPELGITELLRPVGVVGAIVPSTNPAATPANNAMGSATVIVDEAADPVRAARLIAASKTFDNATSCSSENQLIVVGSMRTRLLGALHAEGGRLLDDANASRLHASLFGGGHLDRRPIAKDVDAFLDGAGLEVDDPDGARFVLLEAGGVGPEHPESGEKLSLALTLPTVADFDAALERAGDVLAHQGAGHSIGLRPRPPRRSARTRCRRRRGASARRGGRSAASSAWSARTSSRSSRASRARSSCAERTSWRATSATRPRRARR